MATAAYGNVRARTLFTPEQQRVMDQGGNYAGYAVVDGHFTYVGEGRTGQEAFYAVHPEQRPAATAPATSVVPTSPSDMGMEGVAASQTTATPTAPAVDPNQALVDYHRERDAQNQAAIDAGKAQQRSDAFAAVSQMLEEYGLGGLSDTVRQWSQQDLSASEISLKIRETKEFKDEYGGVLDARKKAGLPAVSVSDILGFRKRAAELFQAAGLPKGFHDDKSDYDKFIAGDVSLAELSDRINLAAQAAYKAPQETRDALAQWGMGPGDMTAFWLNPDVAQPLLERKLAAAQLAGASIRTGFGSLSETQAIGLTQLGVTSEEATTGFSQLQQSQELFGSQDGTEESIGRDEQIAARFGGDAKAQAAVEYRRRKRQATFEGGGGFAGGQGGISGLGAAPSA